MDTPAAVSPGALRLCGGFADQLAWSRQRHLALPGAARFSAYFRAFHRNALAFGAPVLAKRARAFRKKLNGPANHFAKIAIEKVEIR